jgi:hypothetical protein
MSVEPTTVAGFAALRLRTPAVVCTVVPELGGRLVGLARPGGRQWLYRPGGRLRLWRNRPGDAFAASTHVGVDECIPTVEACTVDGRRLPDHGEAWARRWTVTAADQAIALAVEMPGLHLERTLAATGRGIALDYRLVNRGRRPRPWAWAWHGLLAPRPGDRIVLPAGVRRALPTVWNLPGMAAGSWAWPRPAPGVDLARLDLGGSGRYAKCALGPLGDGRAALVGADGERLDLAWSAEVAPWLGLWITRGGYRRQHCLALEPATMAADRLDRGLAQAPVLAPGAAVRWRLELSLR